jgi:hypothetical protein
VEPFADPVAGDDSDDALDCDVDDGDDADGEGDAATDPAALSLLLV